MKLRSCGHTLIELTIVLCLISVLAGIVIVRFPLNSGRQQAIAAARRLGNLMALYRDRAVSEQTTYALEIDPASGRYTFYKTDERSVNENQIKLVVASGLVEPPLSFDKISHGQTVESVNTVMFFDSRGILQDLVIPIAHKDGTRIRIIPDLLTSGVRYEEN